MKYHSADRGSQLKVRTDHSLVAPLNNLDLDFVFQYASLGLSIPPVRLLSTELD
jgi:hypothetical protein